MSRDILAKRRDRLLAVILSFKERECDQYLPPEVQARLRKVILDEVNQFTELAIDLTNHSSGETIVVNELFLQKLEAIHEVVVGSNGA